MKRLEKLKEYSLKSKKIDLNLIKGGRGADGTSTGAGEGCVGGECVSYTGDYVTGGGGTIYYGIKILTKPC